MIKLIIIFHLIISFSFAQTVNDINKKINKNKKQYKSISTKKRNIDRNLTSLAYKINKEEKTYKETSFNIKKTSILLLRNKVELTKAKQSIFKLKNLSGNYKIQRKKMESEVIDFVIEKYAMSMGIEQANKEGVSNIIDKKVYSLIFDSVKDEILNININYLKINNKIRTNEKKIAKINKFIKKQDIIKKRYIELEEKHEKSLKSLKFKHKKYQDNLKITINKQNKLTDLLGNLNILKKKEIKKEESRIKKAKALAVRKAKEKKRKELAQNKRKKISKKDIAFKKRKSMDKDINIEVKKIGSSAKGIKISKYRGKKTIAPLKSYKVIKRFGKYYDDVYKMELFNESVSLKTKKVNSKVFNVFKGQVVYAKENSGLLARVVIVKHKNNLHTIYSHLDKISPTLSVGKWIPKGYVVGRVNDTLEFQATKDSKYIDPLKLIK